MFDMRKRRQLALTAVAAMLAACTTLSRLEPPEVVALTVRNVEIRLPTIRVDTELTLRNPNAVAVSVASLDADLEIGGERAGHAPARFAGDAPGRRHGQRSSSRPSATPRWP
jgi:hypothetical protein